MILDGLASRQKRITWLKGIKGTLGVGARHWRSTGQVRIPRPHSSWHNYGERCCHPFIRQRKRSLEMSSHLPLSCSASEWLGAEPITFWFQGLLFYPHFTLSVKFLLITCSITVIVAVGFVQRIMYWEYEMLRNCRSTKEWNWASIVFKKGNYRAVKFDSSEWYQGK